MQGLRPRKPAALQGLRPSKPAASRGSYSEQTVPAAQLLAWTAPYINAYFAAALFLLYKSHSHAMAWVHFKVQESKCNTRTNKTTQLFGV